MSNDKAQELTKTINDSIATLCAETDAAKQSATYKAWLNTVSRFYRLQLWQSNSYLVPVSRRYPRSRFSYVEEPQPFSQERRTRHPYPCADHSQGRAGAQRQNRGSD